MGMTDRDRQSLLAKPHSVVDIVEAAMVLVRRYYESMDPVPEPLRPLFFNLRKALEGVWGHDMPDVMGPTAEDRERCRG